MGIVNKIYNDWGGLGWKSIFLIFLFFIVKVWKDFEPIEMFWFDE